MIEYCLFPTMLVQHPSSAHSPQHTFQQHSSPPHRYESGRHFGIRDGLFHAVAQGGGEQYLSAFALLLHATPFQLSILSAIPQLVGTWAQLVSVKVSHRFSNRATQVFWGIMGQSLSWIPIVLLPLLWPDQGPWLLIATVAVYFTFTHFTSPVWNSLITDLLDPNERGVYFAKRSRVMALMSFIALCIGGMLLSIFEQQHLLWAGFGLIFVLAGLSRSASAHALSNVPSWPSRAPSANPSGFREFLYTGMSNNFRHFLLFSCLMHAAVLIAGPFFVIFVLQDLHLAHWQYGMWLAAGILGQFLTLPAWGRFSDRFGNKALLTFTSIIVSFLPMSYLFSTVWLFLLTVNFFAGMIWAGLSLGLSNYVFDAVQPTDRAKAVAISSILNAFGWTMGTVIGSWLIDRVPAKLEFGTWVLEPVSNLPFIFFLSGLIRLIVSTSLLRTFHEPREVEQLAHRRLLWELPLLKPLKQLILRRPTGASQ